MRKKKNKKVSDILSRAEEYAKRFEDYDPPEVAPSLIIPSKKKPPHLPLPHAND